MTEKTKTRLLSAVSIALASIGIVGSLVNGTWWIVSGPCFVACVAIAVVLEVRWRYYDKLRMDAYGPCTRCGKPAAYLGAVYCGAACTARAEAGE